MRNPTSGFSALVLTSLFWAPASQAQLQLGAGVFDERCYPDIPPLVEATDNEKALPVEVTSDRAEATQQGKAVYQGDVEVKQGLKQFSSQYTELDQTTRQVTARGNIRYKDGSVTLVSQGELKGDLNSRESTISQASYQLHGSPARGQAELIELNEKASSVKLTGAEFTTCPPGQETWKLKASEVSLDQDEVFGEAWNATLWLKDVPVFYVPYMSFPIKDERKSGLLYPTMGYSDRDGVDFAQPIYWNIAPNYDMTFTPRYIQERGTMARSEFRYLPMEGSEGSLYGEWLGDDRKLGDNRWLINVEHQTKAMDDALRLKVDYTRVAEHDYNYFNDLSPSVGTLVDNQLQQSMQLGYYQPNWNLTGEARDYQILLADAVLPHKLLPRISFNTYLPSPRYDLALRTELANFDHENSHFYRGQRFHIEPQLNLPLLAAPGYQLDSQFRLMYTHYQQQLPDNYDSDLVALGLNHLDKQVDRVLPSVRVSGKLVFDRQDYWYNRPFTQTLEPQFQYLYVPYRNQDNIGLYDTTPLRQEYYSLFSDRRYAGLDRISDANRVSIGATSRIFDTAGTERLRLTLGQSYALVRPKVTFYPEEVVSTNSRSLLSFRGDVRPLHHWFGHTGIEYDTQEHRLSTGSAAVEYQHNEWLGQINYRYVREANLSVSQPDEVTDISQLGLLTRLPIVDHWQIIGAHYTDLQHSTALDSLLGVRYDACCWSINLAFERHRRPDNASLTAESENKLGLQFEFKGLGSIGSGTDFTLDTRLLPYSRPFNLND